MSNLGNSFGGLTDIKKEDLGKGSAHYITYLNIFNNIFIDTKILESLNINKKQNEVKIGDIFITMSSETKEEVGMTSVLLDEVPKNTFLNSFSFGFRLFQKNEFNLLFLGFLFRSSIIRKKITLLSQGISRFNLSKNNFKNLFINYPKSIEQNNIGRLLYLLDKTITLHQIVS